jgi:alanine racemase
VSATLTIDLEALAANYRTLVRAAMPGTCGAVVKSDAYGLGATRIATKLAEAGCRDFFVANSNEGAEVRDAVAAARIFVFDGIGRDRMLDAVAKRLIPVVNQRADFDAWAARPEHPIAVHVDTGMNRLGMPAREFERLDLARRNVVLLMTHLACADEPTHPANARQREAFRRIAQQAPTIPISISNSAGVLAHGGIDGEICRPGIALYGGNPFTTEGRALAAVATLDAPVLQIRDVNAGETVGYGATYVAPAARRVAIVSAGYSDGVPRALSNRGAVGFGALRLPIVGRISMDLTAVDATAAPMLAVGDRVTFFGGAVTVDEVAAWADTISYEILTGVGRRVLRRYR